MWTFVVPTTFFDDDRSIWMTPSIRTDLDINRIISINIMAIAAANPSTRHCGYDSMGRLVEVPRVNKHMLQYVCSSSSSV